MRTILLFSLLVIGGETVLLPAIQLSLDSRTELAVVAIVAVAAALLSDLHWYGVGRFAGRGGRWREWRIGRRLAASRWFSEDRFAGRWIGLLLLSKFLYGCRTPAQILCGVTARRLPAYLAVNLAGTVLLVAYLIGLSALVARGFAFASQWANVAAASAATFGVALLVAHTVRRAHDRHPGI